jgi:outer membrane protein TolC
LAVGLSAVLSRAAVAQEPAAVSLTLEQARARAVEASHRLAEARAREAAALATVAAREAAERPLVAASAGYSRTNHVEEFAVPGPGGLARVIYPDIPDNYRTRLDLQWAIYTGGRTDALERAARAEAAAVAADVDVARADLRLEVARAFWAVVTARATVQVLEQGVTRAGTHVQDARERLDAGLVPPNEIASAQAQEARARMLLIEAQNQLDGTLAELSRLVGADPGQSIEPAANLETSAAPSLLVDALVEEARGARGERLAIERRIEAADAQQAAASASTRPTIAIVGGADYARPNPRIFPRTDRWQESWDVGVNLGWTLWDGGRAAADLASAGHLASAARLRLQEFDSLVAVEIRQRTLDISSGRAAVAAADEAVRAAAEAHRVVTERYRAGVSTQTEVLDAEFALLQAQLDRTRALAGIRLAEARLDRAVGR